MSVSWFFEHLWILNVYFFLWNGRLALSEGPLCFSCSGTSRASFCDYSQRCADGQVCHVQEIRTRSGHTLYSSGCIDNSTCAMYSQHNKRMLLGDSSVPGHVVCFECCNGDMCNNKGCGDPGPVDRSQRGPLCFSCQHLEDPSYCEYLTVCNRDEVCAVEEWVSGYFGSQYSSGCKSKTACGNGVNHAVALPLGKRSVKSRNIQVNLCDYCCDDDFCNRGCRPYSVNTPNTSGTTTATSGPSTIRDTTPGTSLGTASFGTSLRSSSPTTSSVSSPGTSQTSASVSSTFGTLPVSLTTVINTTFSIGSPSSTTDSSLETTSQSHSTATLPTPTSLASSSSSSSSSSFNTTVLVDVSEQTSPAYPTISHLPDTTTSKYMNVSQQTYNVTLVDISTDSFTTSFLNSMSTAATASASNPLTSEAPTSLTMTSSSLLYEWSSWTNFTTCGTNTCQLSTRQRERKCEEMTSGSTVGDSYCTGDSVDVENCTVTCKDCSLLFQAGMTQDGVYVIDPDGQGRFPVYCDMSSGGWIVIQRRTDGKLSFNQKYQDYENGFGDLQGEFWLGLDKIHRLSSANNTHQIKFNLTTDDNSTVWIVYNKFGVEGPSNKYRLFVDEKIDGNLNEQTFMHNSGQEFATEDNDGRSYCGHRRHTGWWFSNCVYLNVNGQYGMKNDETGFVEHFKHYNNLVNSLVEIH